MEWWWQSSTRVFLSPLHWYGMVVSLPGAWGLLSSSPRIFPSLLPCWSSSFCIVSSSLRFHLSCFWVVGMSCSHICSSPWLWPTTFNLPSSSLSYLLAFFFCWLPGASTLILPYIGCPLRSNTCFSTFIRTLPKTTWGNSYIWNSPDLEVWRTGISDSPVSGKRESSVMTQTWHGLLSLDVESPTGFDGGVGQRRGSVLPGHCPLGFQWIQLGKT